MRLPTGTSWFVALADPQGELAAPDRVPPQSWWDQLDQHALFHGTFPAVRRNLALLAARRDGLSTRAEPILEQLARPVRLQAAMHMVLRGELRRIREEAAQRGLSIAVVKGPAAADDLYPSPELRAFSDLDLLVERESHEAADAMLRDMEYQPIVERGLRHDEPYGQTAFTRSRGGLDVRIELHRDLVNSPALQRGVSVGYADLQPGVDGRLSLEAHLVVAVVHGGTSHQFDRLKFLVDVWQIVRNGVGHLDLDHLRSLVAGAGAERSLAMACWLTRSIFNCAPAEELAQLLGAGAPAWLDRLTLPPAVVLPSRAPCKTLRRQMYRSLLKRGVRRCVSS